MHKITGPFILLFILLCCHLPSSAVDKDGNFVIVIDPGHGGKDPGAINGKNTEKSINRAGDSLF